MSVSRSVSLPLDSCFLLLSHRDLCKDEVRAGFRFSSPFVSDVVPHLASLKFWCAVKN